MRGEFDPQPTMFSYVDLESPIPKHHPIRKIRKIVDKALLLQIFFTIRSERQLMERINYDLLFRWTMWSGTTQYFRRTETD